LRSTSPSQSRELHPCRRRTKDVRDYCLRTDNGYESALSLRPEDSTRETCQDTVVVHKPLLVQFLSCRWFTSLKHSRNHSIATCHLDTPIESSIIFDKHTLPFSSLPPSVLCVERTNTSPWTSHPMPSLARLSTSTHLLLYMLVLTSDDQKARTASHDNNSRNREARYICPSSPPANPLSAFGSLQAIRR